MSVDIDQIGSDQLPLAVKDTTVGIFQNGVETLVGVVAVEIQPANPNRKRLIIQNESAGAIRVGIVGVTATTGAKITSGGSMVIEHPYIETASIYAIADGGGPDRNVLTQETI